MDEDSDEGCLWITCGEVIGMQVFNLYGADNVMRNIVRKLIQNQTLLKCLWYEDSDALERPDLTGDEINVLMDATNINKARILFTPFNPETESMTKTELRIFYPEFIPNNRVLAKTNIMFQIVVNNPMWQLDGVRQRPIVMIQEILDTLHGQEVGAIGELMFQDPIRIRYYNPSFSGYEFFPRTRLS